MTSTILKSRFFNKTNNPYMWVCGLCNKKKLKSTIYGINGQPGMVVLELQLCSMVTFAITLSLLYINMIYRATDIPSFKSTPLTAA